MYRGFGERDPCAGRAGEIAAIDVDGKLAVQEVKGLVLSASAFMKIPRRCPCCREFVVPQLPLSLSTRSKERYPLADEVHFFHGNKWPGGSGMASMTWIQDSDNEMTHSDAIEVKRVRGKGRGVFARRSIHHGELIERVPVVVLKINDVKDSEGWTGLAAYCFHWTKGTLALALGYGSLYNHSYRPNARYDDLEGQIKEFIAIRNIEPGEEITVNYNGEPEDDSPVGFKVVMREQPVT
jgi:uncharacterized protein